MAGVAGVVCLVVIAGSWSFLRGRGLQKQKDRFMATVEAGDDEGAFAMLDTLDAGVLKDVEVAKEATRLREEAAKNSGVTTAEAVADAESDVSPRSDA